MLLLAVELRVHLDLLFGGPDGVPIRVPCPFTIRRKDGTAMVNVRSPFDLLMPEELMVRYFRYLHTGQQEWYLVFFEWMDEFRTNQHNEFRLIS